MLRFDYIRMDTTTWEPAGGKPYYTVEIHENLFTLLPRAEAVIQGDIPRKIRPPETGLTRSEEPLVPSPVIREALVNAIMHRDYRVHSPTQVIRYNDRIEFHNPGHSLKPHPEEGSAGSNLRNPVIANVLHETKYAENKGTGIAVMIQEMQKANLSVPEISSDREENRFGLTLYLHNLAGDAEIAWLSQFSVYALSPEDTQILMLVHAKGSIKNADCREHLRLDILQVSRLLTVLCKRGILVKHGGGRNTYYTLSPQYVSGERDMEISGSMRERRN